MARDFCNQLSELEIDHAEIVHNEKRTLWVVILTSTMMVVEVTAGHLTGSMALLADGYHMASHAGALAIAFFVYKLARSSKLKSHLTFGTGKLLPLGGYSSAIGLGFIALWMAIESIQRLFNPVSIEFNEAIVIAGMGLAVNLASAFLLGFGHHHEHDHSHEESEGHVHDHNHKSALTHVLADALTSVTAIFALVIGKNFDAIWLDPAMGIVGSMVILRWAYVLCRTSGWELLDGCSRELSIKKLRSDIEQEGHRILDFHIWKIGPANHACQLIVESVESKGADYFKKFFNGHAGAIHIVVEERTR